MKIGVCFDVRIPLGASGPDVYASTLELCQEAERLGADSVWLSEHHGFADGYLPQPLTMAAAVAARTSRARIGTALVIAPLCDPVALGEQAAVVDLISAGRLDLGLGPGYRATEFELFGRGDRFRRRRDITDDVVRHLRRLWGGAVTPAPAQQRVPILLGYAGPIGARRAGLLGEGLLSIKRDLVEPYMTALAEAGHPAERATLSGPVFACASDDPERDWPVYGRHIAYQQDSYLRHMAMDGGGPAPPPVDLDRLRTGRERGMTGYRFGTPEEIAAHTISALRGVPVDTIFFWGAIGDMDHGRAGENITTLLRRVAPLIRGAAVAAPA
jgi:alkanesulfonate monooxygenase SsuD/methylene tetrahydromethanopterin reductase-like flavin-dependent oxidoreductase (luciferase family)